MEGRPASRSAVAPPPCDTINTRLSLLSLSLSAFALALLLFLSFSISFSLTLSFLSRSRFIHDAQPNGSVVVSSSQQQPATGRSALDWLFVSKRSFCCYAGSPLVPLLSPPLARTLSLFLFLSFTPVPPTLPSLARPAAVPLVCRRERSFMVL